MRNVIISMVLSIVCCLVHSCGNKEVCGEVFSSMIENEGCIHLSEFKYDSLIYIEPNTSTETVLSLVHLRDKTVRTREYSHKILFVQDKFILKEIEGVCSDFAFSKSLSPTGVGGVYVLHPGECYEYIYKEREGYYWVMRQE